MFAGTISAGAVKSRMVCAALLFVLINLAVAYLVPQKKEVLDESVIQNSAAETRQQGKWSWWIARGFFKRHCAPDIAVLGSSQMGSAAFSADVRTLKKDLDCVDHRSIVTLDRSLYERFKTPIRTYNFAMGGAMVSDAFMISKALFRADNKPKVVIIGLGPRDFMDNTLPSVSSTDPFQFFSPYVDIGKLSEKAFPDELARFDWWLDRCVPLKRVHHSMIAYADLLKSGGSKQIASIAGKQKPNKEMLQAVSGSVDDVRRGEWVIPGWFVHCFKDNTPEYLRRYKKTNPPVYAGEKAFFEAFLEHMQQEGIPVLVVGMPSLPSNRAILPAAFWQQFRDTIASTCSRHGATWVDFMDSPDFTEADYLDTVHLDGGGGRKLFAKVADCVEKQPRLASALRAVRVTKPAKNNESPGRSASVGEWH